MAEGVEAASATWRWLALESVASGAGTVVEMPTRPEMGNMAGAVHGGFISLLADSAMGRALSGGLPDGGRVSSFDLKVSFIAPGRLGERLRAIAKVLHSGRRTGVAECRVEGEDGRLVASATASFILHPQPHGYES